MNHMISIEEALMANDKVIGACVLVFVILSFVAWAFIVRRERRVKKLIRRAVAKAQKEALSQCHDKALDNFMHWMDCRIELKKTQAELQEIRRKYNTLHAAAEGCPGVTAAKIEN
jgi:hypothetical protein